MNGARRVLAPDGTLIEEKYTVNMLA